MPSNRDTAPQPTPWEALAQHARALAELADRYAAMPPAALAPTAAENGGTDLLHELDERARSMVSIAAACRVATWRALRDQGMSGPEIGRMWGKHRTTVGKALDYPDRPRGRSRPAPDATASS